MDNSLIELERVKAAAPMSLSKNSSRNAVMIRALPDVNPVLENERIERALSQWAGMHNVQFMLTHMSLGFLITVAGEGQEDPYSLVLSLQDKLHHAFGVDYFAAFSAAANSGMHAVADLEKTAQAAKILRRTSPIAAGIWRQANAVQRFRDSLIAGAFRTHTQPIVCMESMTVIGHELLARAYCPFSGSLIPTGEWIPAVIQGHDSLRLAEEMLKQAAEFMDREVAGYVTINITGNDLASPHFRNALSMMPFEHRSRLVLELVESVDLLSIKHIGRHLDSVRALGCRVALDDFGKAHATFAVLRALQFDIIKLDIGLVHSTSQLDRSLVEVLMEDAKRARVSLVAEGIETRELMHELLERGIKIGQGFYLDSVVSESAR